MSTLPSAVVNKIYQYSHQMLFSECMKQLKLYRVYSAFNVSLSFLEYAQCCLNGVNRPCTYINNINTPSRNILNTIHYDTRKPASPEPMARRGKRRGWRPGEARWIIESESSDNPFFICFSAAAKWPLPIRKEHTPDKSWPNGREGYRGTRRFPALGKHLGEARWGSTAY